MLSAAVLDPDPVAALLARRAQFLAFLRGRGHAAHAEDILHASYLRVLERGVSVRDADKLVGWFYAVLRNAAIDHARARARRQQLRDRLDAEPLHAADDEGERLATMRAAIGELEAGHREVLDAVYVHDLSIAAFAAGAGLTYNAACVRLHRARRALAARVSLSGAVACRRSAPTAGEPGTHAGAR